MGRWILLVLVADLVITAGIVLHLLSRHAAAAGIRLRDLGRIPAFAEEVRPQIVESLRARWNGEPDRLPAAVAGLLDEVAARAVERRLHLDRDELEQLVERALVEEADVPARAAREALRQAA